MRPDAPQARPPERSGDRGAPRAEARGVRRGEAARIEEDDAVRVLRAITRLNIGGPAIQAAGLSAALARDGYETLLVHGRLGEGEGDMTYLVPADVQTRFVPTLGRKLAPWQDVRTFWTMLRIIGRFRPRLLHTHMAKAGLIARAAAIVSNMTHPFRPRIVIVHTYHGHVFDGYFSPLVSAVFITLERLLARASDALIAVSPRVKEELISRYRIGSRERFVVAPLGFELDAFAAIDDEARVAARRDLGIPHDSRVVTTVGRLTAIKNQTLFLDVAQRLERPATFLMVGDGEMREALERAARARGLGDRVRFLGWRRDLAAIYAATDVFAITSRNEGTPVALIEAMAAGVASVSTDVGGVRDVILDETMGIVVPSGDAAALAAAITELVDDPARRKRMGMEARRSVLARHTFARLTQQIAALYRELLRG